MKGADCIGGDSNDASILPPSLSPNSLARAVIIFRGRTKVHVTRQKRNAGMNSPRRDNKRRDSKKRALCSFLFPLALAERGS